MWLKAIPVFRYLRFVPDQEPASLQLTEIVSAKSIDFNPTKAPDVAPIDGPEIVTLSVAEEGTTPCPHPVHCYVSLFAHRAAFSGAVEAGARGALGSSEQPERATPRRPIAAATPPWERGDSFRRW